LRDLVGRVREEVGGVLAGLHGVADRLFGGFAGGCCAGAGAG
jgi:hypothetical protein